MTLSISGSLFDSAQDESFLFSFPLLDTGEDAPGGSAAEPSSLRGGRR
jgi:hypothetical protein